MMDRIHEIFERVKKAENEKGNPDFSYNVDNGFETEFKALIDYFYYSRLNWCGCGDKETVRKFLDAHRDFDNRQKKLQTYFGVEYVYENALLECLAYTMDAAEFTEHGFSISGAWLTEDGKDFLYCLEQNEAIKNNGGV
jgi:hypothetical protein